MNIERSVSQIKRKLHVVRGAAGFTIVELMIATMVFSTVLLVLTAGIMEIGHVYYKGLTESQTQSAVRTIIDNVEQDIQFSQGGLTLTGLSNGTIKGYCIGSRLYRYQVGQLLTGAVSPGVGVSTYTGGCSGIGALPGGSVAGENELLGQRMRVSRFDVAPVGGTNLYNVRVRVVTGEDDLLCSPALNDCGNAGTNVYAPGSYPTDLSCKNIRSGTQYCAASEVSAVVERRVSN